MYVLECVGRQTPKMDETADSDPDLVSADYLGTFISYVFLSHPASDFFGRRYAALIGIFVMAVGAAFQAGASGSGAYAMMVVGRIFGGIGTAIVSTAVPLYQACVSEVFRSRQRLTGL